MAKSKDREIEVLMVKIGERLREIRKKTYSSYERFAYDHDLNRVQYGRYENGKDFRMKSFVKVLKAHNTSLKEFFNDKRFEE